MMVVRSGRALLEDNRTKQAHGGDFVQEHPFHGTVARVVPMLHASEYAAWSQADRAVGRARLGIKRLDDGGHILPWVCSMQERKISFRV